MGKVSCANGTYRYVTGIDTAITFRQSKARKQVTTKKKQSPKKRKTLMTFLENGDSTLSSSNKKRVAVRYAYDEEEEEEEEPAASQSKKTGGDDDAELLELQDEEIGKLKQQNAKLREKGKKLKEALRGTLEEMKELRKENKRLKEKQPNDHRTRMTASKSTLGRPSLDVVNPNNGVKEELAAAHRKIEKLEKALKAATDRADDL